MGFDTPFSHPNNGRPERESQNVIERFWGNLFGTRNDSGGASHAQGRHPHDLPAYQKNGHQLPAYDWPSHDQGVHHHKHVKPGHELEPHHHKHVKPDHELEPHHHKHVKPDQELGAKHHNHEVPGGEQITKHHKHEKPLPEVEIYHPERVGGSSIRDSLYHRQISSTTCEPTALAMAEAQFKTGHRPDDARLQQLAQMTGTVGIGYRRGLEGVKHDVERLGMRGEVHSNSMKELDEELGQGKGAIIRVRNPHTGNPHYIYCFHKENGGYVIGDPDRFNNGARGHDRPISRDALWEMMRHRDGFVSVSS